MIADRRLVVEEDDDLESLKPIPVVDAAPGMPLHNS
jgi:hypothetical protein